MATKIEYHKWMQLLPQIAVFDLEFVGDITSPETCHLWEIGATSLTTNDSFEIIVDPCIGTIPEPQLGCFDLTHTFLRENAVSLKRGLEMFVLWASKYKLFVSHNCFKSDIFVLKGAFSKCKLEFPGFLFVDSLLILRQHVKLTNYKLSYVYQHYIHSDIINNHRALGDANSLKRILIEMGPVCHTIYAYPINMTPLQTINGVGNACEAALINNGILCVEDLENKITAVHGSMYLWHNVTICDSVMFILSQYCLPVQDLRCIHSDILWRVKKKYNIVHNGD
tara:strand:+ start:12 stop:854 length:843 start_codon:yes stop_codon:yes gene_type:complete